MDNMNVDNDSLHTNASVLKDNSTEEDSFVSNNRETVLRKHNTFEGSDNSNDSYDMFLLFLDID